MNLFSEMNQKSRLWIFMAEKTFDNELEHLLRSNIQSFMNDWLAHGQALTADFDIRYKRFLIFAVDELKVKASGCSVDSLFRFVMELEKTFNISLLNRNLLAVFQNEEIVLFTRAEFAELSKTGKISKDVLIFDNTIETIASLEKWKVPAKDSWFNDAFF